MPMRSEQLGEFLILSSAIIYGFFPLLVSTASDFLPPVFFAGVSMLVGAALMLSYVLIKGLSHKLWNVPAIPYILGLTVTMATAYSLIFWGGSNSTGINVSILLQSEIIFTLLIAGFIFREPMSRNKIMASLGVFFGSLMILYNGALDPQWGDLMIVLATALFPFGNRCAQKALEYVPSAGVLFWRYLLGGSLIIALSFQIEQGQLASLSQNTVLLLILANGAVAFGLTKIMWYEGLKRMHLSKAITLGMSFSLFGFFYSMMFLGEVPTFYQFLGLVGVIIGMIMSMRIRSPYLDHAPGEA